MSTVDLSQVEKAEFVVRPDDCRECGGVGQWIVPVMHDGNHIDNGLVSCPACHGTGIRHCEHDIPRKDCQEPGCAVEEVMES